MLALVPWLIFIHILGSITFFLAHGTSVAMAFQLRRETDFARIRALLDLSMSTMVVMFISFLVMGISGLIMPFILKIWNKGWIWASIVLMIVVFLYMVFMNEKSYKHLRRMVGLPYMIRGDQFPAEEPASQAEVEAHIRKLNVNALLIVGYVIPMIVLWFMVFKPF
jgi:small-conductance mechanosensitive channel